MSNQQENFERAPKIIFGEINPNLVLISVQLEDQSPVFVLHQGDPQSAVQSVASGELDGPMMSVDDLWRLIVNGAISLANSGHRNEVVKRLVKLRRRCKKEVTGKHVSTTEESLDDRQ